LERSASPPHLIDRGDLFSLAAREQIADRALAVHHWLSSWWPKNAGANSEVEIAEAAVIVMEQGHSIINAQFSIRAAQSIAPTVNLQPRVSCLMVTKNRVHLAKRAIFCFLQQTYVNKELVIIDDSNNDELQAFIQQFSHPQIAYHRSPSHTLSLGELRNISIAKSTGAYLCNWDDDDLSDPLRLELSRSTDQIFISIASMRIILGMLDILTITGIMLRLNLKMVPILKCSRSWHKNYQFRHICE
jgi:Glycosyl transferase family 2